MQHRTTERTRKAVAEARRQMRAAAKGFADWAQRERWHLVLTLDCASGISRERAERLAKHYWHKVDCELYGNGQVKRQNKRLKRWCFWHGNNEDGRNWHMHCAVQLDIRDADWRQDAELVALAEQFGDCLAQRWRQLSGAGRFVKVELIRDEAAWLHYIRGEEYNCGDSFAAVISTQFA